MATLEIIIIFNLSFVEQPTSHWDGTVHSTTNFSVVMVGGGTVGS